MRAVNRRGFSYVEILFMLATVAIGFATLMWLTAQVGARNVDAREVAAATLIGHNQMEALKQRGYSGLTDVGPVDGTAGPYDAAGAIAPSGKYRVTWDVQKDVPKAGAKRMRVVVAWTTADNHAKTVNLDTVVSHVVP